MRGAIRRFSCVPAVERRGDTGVVVSRGMPPIRTASSIIGSGATSVIEWRDGATRRPCLMGRAGSRLRRASPAWTSR